MQRLSNIARNEAETGKPFGVEPHLHAVIAGRPGDPLDNAIRQNVIDNVAKLKSATPILGAAVEQKKLKVVGGIYRLSNGKIEMIS
jgi:carbonic anhydrase